MAASTSLHESADALSAQTKNFHRAITSLQEELEAVDWYRQRADASDDADLRAVLLHNMREEMEHAAMLLEWLRRQDPDLDEKLRTYLFKSQTLAAVVAAEAEGGAEDEPNASDEDGSKNNLTVGSLKGES